MDVELEVGDRGQGAAPGLGHEAAGERGQSAQGDRPAPAQAELAQARLGLVDRRQDGLGLADQEPAGIGQQELVVDPVEQLAAQSLLELADLLAQRGLGQAQLLGRTGQRRAVHDRPEDAQLMQRDHGPRSIRPQAMRMRAGSAPAVKSASVGSMPEATGGGRGASSLRSERIDRATPIPRMAA